MVCSHLLLLFSQSCPTVWHFMTAAGQALLSITTSWNLLKLMSFESMMSSNHLILCHLFPSFPQSFPGSGSYTVSQFFASGGQSIGASASASVLPMNIQGWFPLGLIGLMSVQSKGLSRVFSNITVRKCQFFSAQFSLWSNISIHDHRKNYSLDYLDLCWQSNVSSFEYAI